MNPDATFGYRLQAAGYRPVGRLTPSGRQRVRAPAVKRLTRRRARAQGRRSGEGDPDVERDDALLVGGTGTTRSNSAVAVARPSGWLQASDIKRGAIAVDADIEAAGRSDAEDDRRATRSSRAASPDPPIPASSIASATAPRDADVNRASSHPTAQPASGTTIQANACAGVQGGYRRMPVEYRIDEDFGDVKLAGYYLTGVVRF